MDTQGGQILTVYQGRTEVFLEMKSMSEVWCRILTLFSIFVTKKELFPSVLLIVLQKQKQKKNVPRKEILA